MLIGYARVSTREQNTSLQLDALKADGCEKIFTERASGALRDRPQLKAALEFMRPGDTLVVWKLDRLARSLKQLLETVENLKAQEKGFRSLTENIDTTTPTGELVFHVFASLAQFERSIISQRTKAGLAAARKRGRVGGRPPALNESDKQAAKAMLRDGKLTVQEIADKLGVSFATFYRYFPKARSLTPDEAQ